MFVLFVLLGVSKDFYLSSGELSAGKSVATVATEFWRTAG